MADTTQQWLELNCGKPSGKWGSTYSDIFGKAKRYELEPTDKNCEELIKLIEKFSYSKHSGAKTEGQEQAKDLMQRNLNEFSYALRVARLHRNPDRAKQIQEQIDKGNKTYTAEYQKVMEVIDEMKGSPIPLIRNTGFGLAGAKRIDMVPSVNVRGAMTVQNVLIINPSIVRNKSELIGLMVHEYHHALCKHNGTYTYVDEIVAHWKEYSIIKPPADPATRIVEVKRQVEKLYASAFNTWKEYLRYEPVTSIDQVGDFLIEDNAASVNCSALSLTVPKAPPPLPTTPPPPLPRRAGSGAPPLPTTPPPPLPRRAGSGAPPLPTTPPPPRP